MANSEQEPKHFARKTEILKNFITNFLKIIKIYKSILTIIDCYSKMYAQSKYALTTTVLM